MLADKELELGDEIGVATKREVELDPFFERRQPELLEPPPFERERLAEQLGGRPTVAPGISLEQAIPERPARHLPARFKRRLQ